MMRCDTLPPGWTYCTIGDLIAHNGIFTDGDWVESKDQDPDGDVRLIQLADVGDGRFLNKSARFLTRSKARELNCTFLETGDLLVARMPDPLGRCCIFPLNGHKQFVTVVDVCAVRPGTSFVDNRYMMYLINCPQVRTEIARLQSGSTRKRISRTNLGTIPLPLAPFKEQIRIVAKIEELFSELDKGVENLKTAHQQLKVYRQAVLKHAFEGKLTEQWRKENKHRLETPGRLLARIKTERERHYQQQLAEWKSALEEWQINGRVGPQPTKPSVLKESRPIDGTERSALPQLPADWSYVRLKDIAQIGSGMSVSKSRKINDAIEVPYLRVANVQRGELQLDEITTMQIERTQLPRLALKQWDVLFNEGGDRDKLGRGWIWESQIEPCITQNHVFRASPFVPSETHAKFISHWGNTFGQGYFDRKGKQTTNLASINKTVLGDFPVPLTSFEEQAQILSELDSQITVIDQLESEIAAGLTRINVLTQAILKKAFSGQLVSQDPNDEPASVLLERIKAEKARATAAPTKSRNGQESINKKRTTVA